VQVPPFWQTGATPAVHRVLSGVGPVVVGVTISQNLKNNILPKIIYMCKKENYFKTKFLAFPEKPVGQEHVARLGPTLKQMPPFIQ
jgi:hypothetical protein